MLTVSSKFKQFWITGDPKRRGRLLAFATCLMAGYGLLFSTLGGQPRTETARQALVIVTMIMTLAPFFGKQEVDLAKLKPSKLKRSVVIVAATALGIFLLGWFSFSLQERLTARSLDAISKGKVSERELTKTSQLLTLAGNSGVVIPKPILDAAYHRLVGTSEHPAESKAWDAGQTFLNYRSSLNVSEMPPGKATSLKPDDLVLTHYFVQYDLGNLPPGFSVIGQTEIEQAARMERIENPIVQPQGLGNQVLVGAGGIIRLDGMRLKHVVFTNVEVHYRGGPLILEDVRFINCRFAFENTGNSRTLSESILTAPRITLALQA